MKNRLREEYNQIFGEKKEQEQIVLAKEYANAGLCCKIPGIMNVL